MAQYEVQHACGHTITHRLYGKNHSRMSRIAWLEQRDCLDCVNAHETALCAQEETEKGWPELTGSPKQISWAREIRSRKMASMEHEITDNHLTARLQQKLLTETTASAWIDARTKSWIRIVKHWLDPETREQITNETHHRRLTTPWQPGMPLPSPDRFSLPHEPEDHP